MSDHNRRPARRMQQRYRQQYQQQQQQQQYRQLQQEQPGTPALPAVPRDLGELKQLLRQYGPLLSAENRAFISELITRLEEGGDAGSLMELAGRMRQAAERQQK